MELIDRRTESRVLDDVLRSARAGSGSALVVCGDPGVGKSALIEYVAGRAEGYRLIRPAGIESEMELAYAGLQQLCMPMLDRLDHLPDPQREALGSAFGLNAGTAPDRLLIGLAALSLLSHVAEEQPLVCLIDDVQWLDSASVRVLSFVARRLGADPIALIMATRTPDPEIAKLPTLELAGLPHADAAALMDSVWNAPLDERIRDQIIAETRGNPLALMELPRDLTDRELAGGFGIPSAVRLSGRIEESFQRRMAALPEHTRRLLLIAAAEPTGDPTLMGRAAARLGIDADAGEPATADGLAEFGIRVRFRHPLVRSAIYRSATLRDRLLAHRALAEVTDSERDPDRCAWHRAQATAGPDEAVAAELERCASRAQARGGLAAAAAFLERATMLTLDPVLRAERALAASSSKAQAGAFEAAADLLAVVEGGPLTDHLGARADLVRAQLAYVTDRGSDAPTLLLKAARRLEAVDAELSRTTYLEALQAAIFAGRLAVGGGVRDVARAARTSSIPPRETLTALLLEGFSTYFTDGYAAAVPTLRRAVSSARHGVADGERRFLWLAGIAALHIWDDESWDVLSARHIELARTAGALAELPLALGSRAVWLTLSGELGAAAALLQELKTVTEATGDALATKPGVQLAATRGQRAETLTMIESTMADVMARGEGIWLSTAEYSEALLHNGIGDYPAALPPAERAAGQIDMALSTWAALELVEAAARACAPISLEPTWSTANGCAGNADAPTPAHSCALRSTCSSRWEWPASPSAHGPSSWRPVRPSANAPPLRQEIDAQTMHDDLLAAGFSEHMASGTTQMTLDVAERRIIMREPRNDETRTPTTFEQFLSEIATPEDTRAATRG
ncbi:AAA family ATPase [Mycolicibacterium smegmatis]|uniref:AAA family ATPase n=1 Tax=Mycolicibacterium smegmatis TaxID=1772 RepID=UPI0023DAE73D|nr:AAA family ATPase [Mycolicibacterium smegmatis]MDF1899233.1 AAA family ATPase [Mycolicibacterium smegmatis]